MSTADIAALPIHRLAEDDAHLWKRVTNSGLDSQVGVMEAWGFRYHAALTWIKPYSRLGVYLRHQTEHLLFSTRGRLPIRFRSHGTWFYASLQDHSHKPEEQYAIIERCSPGHLLRAVRTPPTAGMDGRRRCDRRARYPGRAPVIYRHDWCLRCVNNRVDGLVESSATGHSDTTWRGEPGELAEPA